jgi:hypothetical protein
VKSWLPLADLDSQRASRKAVSIGESSHISWNELLACIAEQIAQLKNTQT